MTARREKLALALELAKQQLNKSGSGIDRVSIPKNKDTQPPQSKMNRLLGKHNIQDQRQGTLLQRTGVVERPTFDVVADKVLGKESMKYVFVFWGICRSPFQLMLGLSNLYAHITI